MGGTMLRRVTLSLIVATAVGSGVLASGSASADGALAIAFPPDISKDGFAIGYTYNYADPEEARNRALESCRTSKSATESVRELCMVIATFRNECFAFAMDPNAGTPGVGFSIAADKERAEIRALAFCAATAGKERREFCKIERSYCDTTK